MLRIFMIAHLLMAVCFRLAAQDIEDMISEELVERIAERSEELSDPEQLAEHFEGTGRKINLNKCDFSDLAKIPFLHERQIKDLLEYISDYGQMLSHYELMQVKGFDSVTIARLLPYICVEAVADLPRFTPGNLLLRSHHDFMFRYKQVIQRQVGYSDSTYAGTPQSYNLRYTWSWFNKIKAGISGEKSAGEQFFRGAQKYGFDYYASYLAVYDLRWLKAAVAGNYTASFGQGLTLGSGFSGAVAGFGALFRYRQGIRPSLSSYSAGNLQGIGVNISIKRLSLTTFYSNLKRDGSAVAVAPGSPDEDSEIQSLSLSGLHRTPTEISKKNRVREEAIGGNISFAGNFFRLGLTGFHAEWDHRINPQVKPYTFYDFRGGRTTNAGIDCLLRLRMTAIFGEVSKTMDGGWAWICGITTEPAQDIAFSVLARDYAPDYRNLFTNCIGQGSRNNNEEGIVLQLNLKPFKKINLSSYVDIYRFPWLKYRVNGPSQGVEAGVQMKWSIYDKATVAVRYTYSHKQQNETRSEAKIHPLEESEITSLRLTSGWQPVTWLKLRNCVEIKGKDITGGGASAGSMASQDIQCAVWKGRISVNFRYLLFDIPVYAFRIYCYEPDVLHSMSVPALEGRGYRLGLLIQMKIYKKCTMWFRYGMVHYYDREMIGTGPETIEGDSKSDLTAQLRISF